MLHAAHQSPIRVIQEGIMAVGLESHEKEILEHLSEEERKQVEQLADKLFPIIYEKTLNKLGAYLNW